MYIYIITNQINGKKYLGQHNGSDPNYMGSGKLLKQAQNKYGIEQFTKEIIEYCKDKQHLNEREIYWGEQYNVVKDNNFYNLVTPGTGGYNEEAVKANKLKKGKTWEEIYTPKGLEIMRNINMSGEKNPFYNKTHTKKTKHKLGIMAKTFHTGRKRSDETKRNIKKGIANSKHSEIVHSQEFADKISNTVSEIWNDKNSVYNTKEYRDTLSEAQLKRWSENPKCTKEELIDVLTNAKSVASALREFCKKYRKISRPTFDRWIKIYELKFG